MKGLIMAGGRGSRANNAIEKPLLEVNHKCLIDYIIKTMDSSKNIEDIYAATSDNAPKTSGYLKSHHSGIIRVHTKGKGYHEDMKEAIHNASLYEPILVVPSDIMFVQSQLLDEIIDTYSSHNFPALTVFIADGLSPNRSTSSFIFQDKRVIAAGINIIDGRHIDDPYQEEYTFLIDCKTNILNVNTIEELEIAREISNNATYSTK